MLPIQDQGLSEHKKIRLHLWMNFKHSLTSQSSVLEKTYLIIQFCLCSLLR